MNRRIALVLVLLSGRLLPAQQTDDVIARAMRDELARSMKELRLGDLERPYFIAYRINEVRTLGASASSGSLLSSSEDRSRYLDVEVRVGDYRFDNTNFAGGGASGALIAIGGGAMGFGNDLPLDDSYLEIRRRLWRATDAAYKEAAETFSAKKAALLNRARTDTMPDFSREAATQTVDEMAAPTLAKGDAESLVRELSSARELASLNSATVSLRSTAVITRYLNSEGTSFTTSRPLVTLSVSASTQAVDGQPLSNAMRVTVRSASALPSREELTRAVRELGLRLDSLRSAAVAERYSGPVLFEGRAAAELFSSVFAPALVAQRRPEGGDPGFAMMFDQLGRGTGSLSDKVGSRVLPEMLSVLDDPTIPQHEGRQLLGTYKVDEQGVAGRRKTMVEAGILRSLLSTRTPVEEMPKSSGNDRGMGAAPSSMLVTSSTAEDDAALRERLMALVKRRGLKYGIIVRELGSSAFMPEDPMAMMEMMRQGVGGRGILRAYRVYADGREELVRAATLSGLTVQTFRDIVAVSKATTVYHRPAIGAEVPFFVAEMAAEFGDDSAAPGMSSFVVPSLLFEDVAVTKSTTQLPKPPLSDPPKR